MLCPLADNAAPAAPAVSSGHVNPAVCFLRVPLKPGRKPSGLSAEQIKAKHRERHRVRRKRKKEEDAALVVSEKKAKDEPEAARAKVSQLATYLTSSCEPSSSAGRSARCCRRTRRISRVRIYTARAPSSKVRTYTYMFACSCLFLFVFVSSLMVVSSQAAGSTPA